MNLNNDEENVVIKVRIKNSKVDDGDKNTDMFFQFYILNRLNCFNHNAYSYLLQFVRTITFFNLQKDSIFFLKIKFRFLISSLTQI